MLILVFISICNIFNPNILFIIYFKINNLKGVFMNDISNIVVYNDGELELKVSMKKNLIKNQLSSFS